jgi:hypothetical protein
LVSIQVQEDLRHSRSEAAAARDQAVVQVRRVVELEAALQDRNRDLAVATTEAAAAAAERERASGAEQALLAGMEAEREKAAEETRRLVDETRGALPLNTIMIFKQHCSCFISDAAFANKITAAMAVK